eukprot:m.273932 g.273932  ORF g.273932 m.273932 type:complete len:406 (-) comp19756_c0_seq23:2071-3288(-)
MSESMPWFRVELLSSLKATEYLRDYPVGAFVVRSAAQKGNFILSVKTDMKAKTAVTNVTIESVVMPAGSSYNLIGSTQSFPSLKDLVTYYATHQIDGKFKKSVKCLLNEDTMSVPVTASAFRSKDRHVILTKQHIGEKVTVRGYSSSTGVLLFVGIDPRDKQAKCGVRMDNNVGANNGTVGGVKFFSCDPGHGVLCDPGRVELQKKPAGERPPVSRERRDSNASANSITSAEALELDTLELEDAPWYVGKLDGAVVRKCIRSGTVGDFVVRASSSTARAYILVVLLAGREVKEYKMTQSAFGFSWVSPRAGRMQKTYDTIDEILKCMSLPCHLSSRGNRFVFFARSHVCRVVQSDVVRGCTQKGRTCGGRGQMLCVRVDVQATAMRRARRGSCVSNIWAALGHHR